MVDHLSGKVGVVGDIHAEHDKLARALEHLHSWGAERILAVGDIVDGVGSVDRCCVLLHEADVRCVRGNHERWFFDQNMRSLPHATHRLDERSMIYLRELPPTRVFETPLGTTLLCHGLGLVDTIGVKPDDQGYALLANEPLHAAMRGPHRLMINGHTHRRMVRHFPGLTIVNVGTLRSDHQPCFAGLDFDQREVRFWSFDDYGGLAESETCDVSTGVSSPTGRS